MRDIQLMTAVIVIQNFLRKCKDISTAEIRTEDGISLFTDWGYVEDGLEEILKYAKGGDE